MDTVHIIGAAMQEVSRSFVSAEMVFPVLQACHRQLREPTSLGSDMREDGP